MRLYELDNNPYMSKSERLSKSQRYILVHCVLYYEMDDPVISDASYKELCNIYEEDLQQSSEVDKQNSRYWNSFKNFDSSTGFDLYSMLSEEDKEHIGMVAWNVRMYYHKNVLDGGGLPC